MVIPTKEHTLNPCITRLYSMNVKTLMIKWYDTNISPVMKKKSTLHLWVYLFYYLL